MNESETRAELIDPKLKACGWGVVEGSKILREYKITEGKIQIGGIRAIKLTADYVLVYKGIKLAVVEAKSDELEVGEGVAQAKQYAEKLKLETTYSSNGKEIYSICMKTGKEGLVSDFLNPEKLWNKTYSEQNTWRENFAEVPFSVVENNWDLRFYQEIAMRNTLEAIAKGKKRILLTLATGTGKTAIACQIAWKLFQTRWNLKLDGGRRTRVLFLTDRNILADQAFNEFSVFHEDVRVRIKSDEVKKNGRVPTSGNIFFTIYQTFMCGENINGEPAPFFGEYPKDYFDLVVVDECHRGGSNDESKWRVILEYFSPAVQLGLTATPRRDENVNTYEYFGEPVYTYSLSEGINDGFLTPFKLRRIKTTLDDYIFTNDDEVIEGDIEEGRIYLEQDFNKIIEIKEREAKRVKIFLEETNQNEKAIIFCATQEHAALIRDLINQFKTNTNTNYCVRVTANDGGIGDTFLREFQDNDRTIPTILTTSRKLSTGVDARNIRSIVLMRKINSMIEFKQIIGRGTRLFDGKEFFTIYDFVDAYTLFHDEDWDGNALMCEECGNVICECIGKPKKVCKVCGKTKCECKKESQPICVTCGELPCICKRNTKIKVKLRDGKEREIQSMISTMFYNADGKIIMVEEFLDNLLGAFPKIFKNEDELRELWSNPITRKLLLQKLEEAGYPKNELMSLQKLVNMENSDLFDVLSYIFNGKKNKLTREERVKKTQSDILQTLNNREKEFIQFVLTKYIESGYEELFQDKLPTLLENKYRTLEDARSVLGELTGIGKIFVDFQQQLYGKIALV